MKRRDFLKFALYAPAAVGSVAGLSSMTARAQVAAGGTAPYNNALINIMLLGGADLRFLFVPAPGSEYASQFWQARRDLYLINGATYPDYLSVWNDLYLPTIDPVSKTQFGIHKNAAWLKDQFDLGNVGIVSNVIGARNRRHDHAQLVVHTGDPTTGQFDYDRDGWGGRLAHTIGNANTVVVSRSVSVFAKGIDASNRNAKVVHAKDTRKFGLSNGDGNPVSDSTTLGRALRGYYSAKAVEAEAQTAGWPYRKFLQHEQSLRSFGDVFNQRLASVAPSQPPSLQALYNAQLGTTTLSQPSFGKQCASVYDSFVGADLFQLRCAYMEYGGWDHHRLLKSRFEPMIGDLFGAGKGLDTLSMELQNIGADQSTTFVINTDFGRQLAANGDNGTDHGRGNYSILIGPGVAGGVYGEMFPANEISGAVHENHFSQPGSDIEGRTALENVLAAACNWVEPSAGNAVFSIGQNRRPGLVENGVSLDTLFA